MLSHLPLLEPLSDAEKTKLNAKVIRHHFQADEQLLTQGMAVDSAHFIFSGVIQVTREAPLYRAEARSGCSLYLLGI